MTTLEHRLIEFALAGKGAFGTSTPVAGMELVVPGFRCYGEDLSELVSSTAPRPAPQAENLATVLCKKLANAELPYPLELWLPTVSCCVAATPPAHDLSEAMLVGLEAGVRVAGGLESATGDWWDRAAIAGVVGASIALARLMELSISEAGTALAHSATQAPRFRVQADPLLRSFLMGGSAAGIIEAVFAARAGLTAPGRAITGERGLFAVLGTGSIDTEPIAAGLGETWRSRALIEHLFSRDPTPCSATDKVWT